MRFLFFLFLLINTAAQSQALRDINYKYLYDGGEAFTFNLKASRQAGEWVNSFELGLTDTTADISPYSVDLELRKTLFEKQGVEIPGAPEVAFLRTANTLRGQVSLPHSDQIQILVARVTNSTIKRAWYFYSILEPKYPEITNVLVNGKPWLKRFINDGEQVSFTGNRDVIVSYFDNIFPAATPAFAEKLGQVSPGMKVDTSFVLQPLQPLPINKTGLYLAQYDTAVAEGVAFRIEDDYPRYARVESLADPLIYVCTRQEYERMKQAKGDKRAFDRIILGITGDAGRARIFMKSYFRRVEMANTYFSSYKEGWKTDRGMIYIVFGPPDEVFKFNDREVWNYDNRQFKVSFDFAKSPSLFDPENYVLLRNKKYTQTWYEVIDLWRNARFTN